MLVPIRQQEKVSEPCLTFISCFMSKNVWREAVGLIYLNVGCREGGMPFGLEVVKRMLMHSSPPHVLS
jgi:hypothetical protein